MCPTEADIENNDENGIPAFSLETDCDKVESKEPHTATRPTNEHTDAVGLEDVADNDSDDAETSDEPESFCRICLGTEDGEEEGFLFRSVRRPHLPCGSMATLCLRR
jgi:hypothetical protein